MTEGPRRSTFRKTAVLGAVARALGMTSEEQATATNQHAASEGVTVAKRDCHCVPTDCGLHRVAPVATDANRRPPATEAVRDRVSICEPVPTIEARPPADHAAALLGWLQGPGGRTGTIPATELERMHWDVCHELGWEVVSWVAVGRELRRLLGAKKEYVRREDGRRVRVYRVPPVCAARIRGDAKCRADRPAQDLRACGSPCYREETEADRYTDRGALPLRRPERTRKGPGTSGHVSG